MKFPRRSFNKYALASLLSPTGIFHSSHATEKIARPSRTVSKRGIPLILDTDIGDDLDDTWALMMLLRSPRLDVKLITTGFGNTIYRTRLLTRLLQAFGHTHVPVGIGLEPIDKPGNQSTWLANHKLTDYPGVVHEDGIQALIDTINQSPEPVTLLCIGPVMNIAEALRRDPSIVSKARFVGMQGSIRIGYDGETVPAAEWNVKVDPLSLQTVFAAPWDCSITPLDSCGLVKLSGERYQDVFHSSDPWAKILVKNYRAWLPKATWLDPLPDLTRESSTLFDTVAVYLAYSQHFLVMEDLPLRVTDAGYTIIDEEKGRLVHCATGWKDMDGFKDLLVELITKESISG